MQSMSFFGCRVLVTTHVVFSRDYIVLTEKGKLKDIDGTDRDRFCQYIFYNGLSRLGYARISHGGLTDTEIQAARFKVEKTYQEMDKNQAVISDNDKVKEIDKDLLFSSVFGGFFHGHYHSLVHHYHMSTPKYFVEE